MASKPGLEQRSIGLPDATWKWLERQAKENERSVVGQIRFYLERIKDGKIKVEGIGG